MKIKLVDAEWGKKIAGALRKDASELRIICPFIKRNALERLLQLHPKKIEVITRFNLTDFATGVSDIAALHKLLKFGADVRGIKNLHAKVYLFGASRAIITSANLTQAALYRNHEFGVIAEDASFIKSCRNYFNYLWKCGGENLTREQLEDWDKTVTHHFRSSDQSSKAKGLGDFGKDIGIVAPLPSQEPAPVANNITPPTVRALTIDADTQQSFVKFLGKRETGGSEPLSCPIVDVVKDGECHWSLTYPSGKRPNQPKDGDAMFIARLTEKPNDIRIFGCATAMKYVEGRDEATAEDIARRDWKKRYSRYIRVYDAEFINGTLENGVSLYEMMDTLESDSFESTQRNEREGKGNNTDPRQAYNSQPHVRLSKEGFEWLRDKLQLAFGTHGKIPDAEIDKLYLPSNLPIPIKRSI